LSNFKATFSTLIIIIILTITNFPNDFEIFGEKILQEICLENCEVEYDFSGGLS